MQSLVKITVDDEGYAVDDPKWHVITSIDAKRTLCTGEVFGFGESSCEFEEKQVKRGGITCPNCIEFVKNIKGIKL